MKCVDGSLYTGYTTDLENRIEKHKSGKGAKYTRGRLPVELIYWEPFADKSSAMKREYQIKQLSRLQKFILICQK